MSRSGTDESVEPSMGIVGVSPVRDQPKAAPNPKHVGIDWHRGQPEAEQQDAGRGLGANAGQLEEPGASLLRAANLGANRVTTRPSQTRSRTRRAVCAEPSDWRVRRAESHRRALSVRCRRRLPGWKASPERGKGAAGVHVGRVLGEDRGDELVERRRVRLPNRPAIVVGKPRSDLVGEGGLCGEVVGHDSPSIDVSGAERVRQSRTGRFLTPTERAAYTLWDA